MRGSRGHGGVAAAVPLSAAAAVQFNPRGTAVSVDQLRDMQNPQLLLVTARNKKFTLQMNPRG